jgi:hypothetical protein
VICGVSTCVGLTLLDAPAAGAAELAEVGKSVVGAVRGPENELAFYTRAVGGSTWTVKAVISPRIVGEPSITGFGSVSAEIAAETRTGGLTTYSRSAATGDWTEESVAGAGKVYSQPSIARIGAGG